MHFIYRTPTKDLVPLNPKIEATCSRNKAVRRRRKQETQGSNQPSPPSPQSHYQMEEKHAR